MFDARRIKTVGGDHPGWLCANQAARFGVGRVIVLFHQGAGDTGAVVLGNQCKPAINQSMAAKLAQRRKTGAQAIRVGQNVGIGRRQIGRAVVPGTQ